MSVLTACWRQRHTCSPIQHCQPRLAGSPWGWSKRTSEPGCLEQRFCCATIMYVSFPLTSVGSPHARLDRCIGCDELTGRSGQRHTLFSHAGCQGIKIPIEGEEGATRQQHHHHHTCTNIVGRVIIWEFLPFSCSHIMGYMHVNMKN